MSTFTNNGGTNINLLAIESRELVNAAGAVSIHTDVTEIGMIAVGTAYTLADGVQGQVKNICAVSEVGGTDTAIITPSNLTGFTTITFDDVGQGVVLKFTNGSWVVVGNHAATVA